MPSCAKRESFQWAQIPSGDVGDVASPQAATSVNAEEALKLLMWKPTAEVGTAGPESDINHKWTTRLLVPFRKILQDEER